MKAVILAAGVGSRLAPLTNDRPKALVEVRGRSFLFRQLDLLERAGIVPSDVVVVGGYRADRLEAALDGAGYRCEVVRNDRFEPWNNFYSLLVAERALAGHDFIQLDGDVILDDRLLPRVIAAPGDAVLALDCRDDLDAEAMKAQVDPAGRVVAISKQLDPAACAGEFIGIAKLGAGAARQVFAELARFPAEGLTHEYYEHAFHRLAGARAVPFTVVDVHDCSPLEIDTVEDLQRAEAVLARIA